MTEIFHAVCSGCGHRFVGERFRGFEFEVMHCRDCGAPKRVGIDEVVDLSATLQEIVKDTVDLVDSLGPERFATADKDPALDRLHDAYDREFDRVAPDVVGTCKCGGSFSLTAPVRCPACGSETMLEEQTFMFED